MLGSVARRQKAQAGSQRERAIDNLLLLMTADFAASLKQQEARFRKPESSSRSPACSDSQGNGDNVRGAPSPWSGSMVAMGTWQEEVWPTGAVQGLGCSVLDNCGETVAQAHARLCFSSWGTWGRGLPRHVLGCDSARGGRGVRVFPGSRLPYPVGDAGRKVVSLLPDGGAVNGWFALVRDPEQMQGQGRGACLVTQAQPVS